ncbi:tubulin-specific chaperone D-like [Ornithodoros turicata]|uniref:tubulin-specific chaperone D-like n=1 Tax=Ornithodoros turicata TaxID=34597 RepID=UPI003139B760
MMEQTPTQVEPSHSVRALDAFEDYDTVINIVRTVSSQSMSDLEDERLIQKFKDKLDKYLEQPHLLDSCIDEIVKQLLLPVRSRDCRHETVHRCLRYLLVLTRVRGYKVIARCFPHEITDVEPVLQMLEEYTLDESSPRSSLYMLLLWLSILAMVPFELSRLESGDGLNKSIAERVLNVIKENLRRPSEANLGSAIAAARFIGRPDVTLSYLEGFISWLLENIDSNDGSKSQVTIGVLSSLAGIFKSIDRKHLAAHITTVVNGLAAKNVMASKDILVRKLALKLTQRIGLSLLPPTLAPWRYLRSTKQLVDSICSSSETRDAFPNIKEEEAFDIPEVIEEIIDKLLEGLSDEALVVRWSAAKGIGRITSRLPKDLASEVVSSIFSFFDQQDNDCSFHGGLLAMAELGRRGCLLPCHLPSVVKAILPSLVFDEQRGRSAVGAIVRDAACYVCWTLGRSYDPVHVEPFVESIASTLVSVAVFDREVNCRRAAAAAFQECVGRLGTFPHGISIITIANYFSTSILTTSYLEVSMQIADFPEYTRHLIQHLVESKVCHWDVSMRKLASQALFKLTAKDPEYVKTSCLPKLVSRLTSPNIQLKHGALLAVAEVVEALSIWAQQQLTDIKDVLGSDTVEQIKSLLATYENDKTFIGIGHGMMKGTFCFLLCKLASSHFPVHGSWELLEHWTSLINKCLTSTDSSCIDEAPTALCAIMQEYYGSAPGHQEKVVRKCLENIKSEHREWRRNFAHALGCLPDFIHVGYLPAILRGLIECATTDGAPLVHSRREAILALSKLCKSVVTCGRLTASDIDQVMEALLCGMDDYSQSKEGDMGLVVRMASMLAFKEIVCFLAESKPELIQESHISRMMSAIAQQCVEVVDENRRFGTNVFIGVLYSTPVVPHIPHFKEAQAALPPEVSKGLGFAYASNAFPYWAKFLPLMAYRRPLFKGFLVSSGSRSEHVFEPAKDALASYLLSLEEDRAQQEDVCKILIDLLEDSSYTHRALTYYMTAISRLVTDGAFRNFPPVFFNELQHSICVKTLRSKSFVKLQAAVIMLCGLLQFEGESRLHLLQRLLLLLTHQYERLRMVVAEKLCEAFLLFPFLDNEHMDEACTILSETNWYAPRQDIEPMRQRLASILGIEIIPQQK